MPNERQPPPIEQIAQRLATRIARDGRRHDAGPCPAAIQGDEARRQRSLRCCHLPAEPKARHPVPRPSGAYIPELAARLEDDRNLTDGARRCARKLAEYIYRRNREGRAAEITVTYLMRALGKCRRTVQRYLRQLERESYIAVEVIHAGTRMCAGLLVELLAPLFPRHRRQKWPQTRGKPDATQEPNRHLQRPYENPTPSSPLPDHRLIPCFPKFARRGGSLWFPPAESLEHRAHPYRRMT